MTQAGSGRTAVEITGWRAASSLGSILVYLRGGSTLTTEVAGQTCYLSLSQCTDSLILYLEDDGFRPWPNLPTGPR